MIAAILAATGTPMPTPTFDPAEVTPGPVGFFATVVLMLAVGALGVSLMNRMSKLQARYAVREELEREEAAREAAAAEQAGAAEAPPTAEPADPPAEPADPPVEPGR